MQFKSIIYKATKYTAVLAILSSLVLPNSYRAEAAITNVQQNVQSRTEQELRSKWQQYLPENVNTNNLFAIEPSLKAPYRFGQLNTNVLEDALNATNFARYLAGLPDDVTLDYSLEEQQQAGAVLTAHHGKLSHYPSKPSDMLDSFFELGYKSASSSNLSAGRNSLYNTVFFGYMSDQGTNNLPVVGHRRWIINPQMKSTMFGLAVNPNSTYTYYSTMSAFNRDRDISEVEYDYIAWPSAGLFPTDILSPMDPWSVSLNTSLYDKTLTSDIYVEMTRESDNKTWRLDASSQNYDGNFFSVNTGNYGIDYAIIFRPEHIGQYIEDVYHVTIHNVYTLSGEPTSISYTTNTIPLQATFENTSRRYSVVGQRLELPVVGTASRFTSSDSSIASVDSHGIVTTHKPGNVTISVDNYIGNKNFVVSLHVKGKSSYSISDWAKATIERANEYGILHYNPYEYDMKKAVTRDEFVNYVVSMLQALDPSLELYDYYEKRSPFSDVHDGDAEIIWAYEHGIINGTGKGKFSPYVTITREQAATLLLNVYHYLNGTEHPADVKPFADQAKIADWAKNAVTSMAGLSIMNGVSATNFDPKGKYSHEQTITTTLRLYEKMTK